jgi:hypothetical protein
LTDFKEEGHVPDVVQPEGNQRTLDHTIQCKRSSRITGRGPARKLIDGIADWRPDETERDARDNRRTRRQNGNRPFARKKSEIRG